MEKPWSYEVNPIEAATFDSYRSAKKIGDFTDLALAAHPGDVFLTERYTVLHPFVTAYNTKYAAWVGQQGGHKAQTSGLNALFRELSGIKIRNWDIAIQNVYPEDTVEYLDLLPNHRRPFQRGSQEDRLTALTAFNTKVAANAGLGSALKADVAAFLAALNAQYGVQKGAVSTTKGASEEVEAARVALCIELYGLLGLLMNHFKTQPSQINQFFDLQTIRNHEQSVFTNSVVATGKRTVMTHTFATGEDVKLINDGLVPLRFGLAPDAAATPIITIPLTPGEAKQIDADELGDLSYRYLIVMNEGEQAGHYTVMLV